MFGRKKYNAPVLVQHIRCPECGVPMVERNGATGVFYGCARFPLCIGSRPKGGSDPDSYTESRFAKAGSYTLAEKYQIALQGFAKHR